jgi:hypothetical protein
MPKLGPERISTAIPGYTHGIYYHPDFWPFAQFYIHSRGSYEEAAEDAYQLACVDDTGYYIVKDYETGEIVYNSRPDNG